MTTNEQAIQTLNTTFNTIVNQQKKHGIIKNNWCSDESQIKDILNIIHEHILADLSPFVGVQVLTQPVQYIHQMIQKNINEDGNKLKTVEIVDHVTESNTFKFDKIVLESEFFDEKLIVNSLISQLFKEIFNTIISKSVVNDVQYPVHVIEDLIKAHTNSVITKTGRADGLYTLIPSNCINDIVNHHLSLDSQEPPVQIADNVSRIGTINNKQITIYSTDILNDIVIVGRQGYTNLDGGCFYCPFYFLPESLAGVKIDPTTFLPIYTPSVRHSIWWDDNYSAPFFSLFKIQV